MVLETQGDLKKLFRTRKNILGASGKCVLLEYENELTLSNTFNSFFMDTFLKILVDIFKCYAMKIVREKLLDKDANTHTL